MDGDNPNETEEQRRAEIVEYFRENPPIKMPSRPILTSEYFQMEWSTPTPPPPPVQAPDSWSIEKSGKPLDEMTETELGKRAEELEKIVKAIYRPKRDERGAMAVPLWSPANLVTSREGTQTRFYSISRPRTSEKPLDEIQRVDCVADDDKGQ